MRIKNGVVSSIEYEYIKLESIGFMEEKTKIS